jgi:site-specific recombinase XerD
LKATAAEALQVSAAISPHLSAVNSKGGNPMPTSNALLMSDFVSYLWHGGTTDKAIADHERTLADLATWLDPVWLREATRIRLQVYIGDCLNQGTSPRNVARRLSHLRRFYQFLKNERQIFPDPTLDLRIPKHWTKGKEKNSITVLVWMQTDIDTCIR